jgi:16S rRNA (guanine(966)-N(2))-methyltransferase RsmD
LRVIAGEFRGRKLDSFEGMDIRPTSDRVKESLFNILNEKVIDCSFLDLFGGSGNIGIEALSRGADKVVFIDSNIKSIKVLKGNLIKINKLDSVEVYNTDYETAISKLGLDKRIFDIIFIDPPYNMNIAQNAIIHIDKCEILSNEGIIIVEHDSKDVMPEKSERLIKFREKQYGGTKLTFYKLHN